jgi:hypothetical protein
MVRNAVDGVDEAGLRPRQRSSPHGPEERAAPDGRDGQADGRRVFGSVMGYTIRRVTTRLLRRSRHAGVSGFAYRRSR